MKFTTSSIVAMLVSFAAFSLPFTHASDLVIRALDTDGNLAAFADCAQYAGLIGTELNKFFDGDEANSVEGEGRRALRSRELQSTFCKNHCKGFKPGWCQLVYRQCTGMRRNLDKGESFANPPELKEDKTLACTSLQSAIHDKLEELAGQVDETCKKELLAPKEFKCFRVVQN